MLPKYIVDEISSTVPLEDKKGWIRTQKLMLSNTILIFFFLVSFVSAQYNYKEPKPKPKPKPKNQLNDSSVSKPKYDVPEQYNYKPPTTTIKPKIQLYSYPEPHDARGPCPMLNALANHGLIPRNGRNINKTEVGIAMDKIFNFDPTLLDGPFSVLFDVFKMGVNGSTVLFDLDRLHEHNKLEHDLSLVRKDAYFGDHKSIDKDLLRRMLSFCSPTKYIGIPELAAYRKSRNADASLNPELVMTNNTQHVILTESAVFMSLFSTNATCGVTEEFFGSNRIYRRYSVSTRRIDLAYLTEIAGKIKMAMA